MPMYDIDLLEQLSGSVVAPAGCGKTQLIADTLSRGAHQKPVLVLTHTNAGVHALRARLHRMGVPSSDFKLATIDGWALRLISTFPKRSNHTAKILLLKNPNADYLAIREAALQLLVSGHLDKPLRATYSRVLVDEYQDCTQIQHAIVCSISTVLSTCVLGDPLQAIFGFGGARLADWSQEVEVAFKPLGKLSKPWRWINSGAEPLGRWLLEVRQALLDGNEFDLRDAPDAVEWIELKRGTEHAQRIAAARTKSDRKDGGVLIVADSTSPVGQRKVASQTPGALTVEAADLRDLTTFGLAFQPDTGTALQDLVEFAGSLMTNVNGDGFLRRVQTLRTGKARKAPTDAETAALAFCSSPGFQNAAVLLQEIRRSTDVRLYRTEMFHSCIQALRHAAEGSKSFHEATVHAREVYRHKGRTLPQRAVGSTLLLKGLEADVVVILKPEEMDARNLYVALTRGARKVVLCSEKPVLRATR